MPKRIKIPRYVKAVAREGLRERRLNKAGLTKYQATDLGISSGVERARQLIRNKYLKERDAKAIARFYLRFRNKKTPRANTALKLWGGKSWGFLMAKIYYGFKG